MFGHVWYYTWSVMYIVSNKGMTSPQKIGSSELGTYYEGREFCVSKDKLLIVEGLGYQAC